ncbi:MAG: TylF/MycF/NovP-related O-methyltransferase [Candidatus Hodarchaeales archaeon]|jgi:SAM-dependent methyltransferase
MILNKEQLVEQINKSSRSMVDVNHLMWLMHYMESNKVKVFVEVGVAKGGVLALVAKINPNTKVFGLDSWEGMPKITKEDNQAYKNYEGVSWATMNDVYDTFKSINAPSDNLELIKGYCEETIPKNISILNNIDILRIDIDWYKGTKYCLENLYNNVNPGGLIIIDDYHWNVGCKQAVDDFLQSIDNKPIIHKHPSYENRDFGPIHFFKNK